MAETLAGSIRHFRRYWKNYLFQSFLVASTLFVVFSIFGIKREVLIASIGATAFIVFCLPDKFTAKPKNVIGGHLVGLACGYLGTKLCTQLPAEPHFWYSAAYAISVGLTAFVMVLLDVEHPPAAGTALGVAIGGFTFQIGFVLLTIVILLSVVRTVLKKHIIDLA